MSFRGAGVDKTILRLASNSPAFQNASNPVAFVSTKRGNRSFRQFARDFTIIISNGNPGAIGIDYHANNRGSLRDVRIAAEGNAVAGISMQRRWPGPALIKRVSIEGFDYGMVVSQSEYGMVLEHVSLRNQRLAGINHNSNMLSIRGLTSIQQDSSVPALSLSGNGFITLLDSSLKATAATPGPAITSSNHNIYARNVYQQGYSYLLAWNGTTVAQADQEVYFYPTGDTKSATMEPATDAEVDPRSVSKQKYLKARAQKWSAEDPFNVESWYTILKDLTFKTTILEMTEDEAKAIIASYRSKYMKRSSAPLTPEQNQTLIGASKRLHEKIKELDKGNGVFVRLSTRSPKDSAMASPQEIAEMMADSLSRKHKIALAKALEGKFFAGLPAEAFYDPEKTLTLNEKLQCMFEVFLNVMKVRSGDDAIKLILDSERVYMDLMLLLDAIDGSAGSETPVKFQMNYILREWVDIPVGLEFRGFVFKGALTALTQYDNLVSYDEIVKNKQKIKETIQKFYCDSVRPALKVSTVYDCAVVDFALLRDGDDYVAKVVELNPYNNYEGAGTGGSLFHWNFDREVLEGIKPFEFRTLDTAPDLSGRVFPDWVEIIEAGERVLLDRQNPKRPSSTEDVPKSDSSCIVC
eukprot:TRINITY_DN3311_c0_g1_i4.p1 TRINITY_DN3311_c0_g1~~TRINITY_DN3311_c0_g1_i4.p1  ORF type:complete len:637 (+),score=82.28 TRINITY_DN3311_c0_g1_i4:307-2217(+)